MSVQQGLKSLAESNPNFSNTGVEAAITLANIGFITKTKTLHYLVDVNSTLTDPQKVTIRASLNVQPYLNAGRYLQDLSNHTSKILDGTLGETDPNDVDTATFQEHLGTVDGIQGSYLALYGQEASAAGKGVDDYFGTLRQTMNGKLTEIRDAAQIITNGSLAENTAFQAATQALIDFVNALGDSTTMDTSTLNSLLSAYESAANNFNTVLTAAAFSLQKSILVSNRAAIVAQIATEVANLGTIRTYATSLATLQGFQSLAGNSKIRDLIGKAAQTTAWKDYYENYETRFAQINLKYENALSDSENETIITNEMTQRGLPDVKNHTDHISGGQGQQGRQAVGGQVPGQEHSTDHGGLLREAGHTFQGAGRVRTEPGAAGEHEQQRQRNHKNTAESAPRSQHSVIDKLPNSVIILA